MRVAPVYPMMPVRAGSPLEELAAFLEADQADRDYLATSREHGFMHPLTLALSEYRAISQTAHERIEYRNVHG
ncbi:hypothetical protein [Streptomyces decoyicus]|uniref:hypothetical protein n=1 Tax=Streptomyces decoyicus TaxID=249567 RepID=UPI003649A96D